MAAGAVPAPARAAAGDPGNALPGPARRLGRYPLEADHSPTLEGAPLRVPALEDLCPLLSALDADRPDEASLPGSVPGPFRPRRAAIVPGPAQWHLDPCKHPPRY